MNIDMFQIILNNDPSILNAEFFSKIIGAYEKEIDNLRKMVDQQNNHLQMCDEAIDDLETSVKNKNEALDDLGERYEVAIKIASDDRRDNMTLRSKIEYLHDEIKRKNKQIEELNSKTRSIDYSIEYLNYIRERNKADLEHGGINHLDDNTRTYVLKGPRNKIERIKRLRRIADVGLKEAKEWVEAYERIPF